MFITLWECPTNLLNNICYCCVYTFHIFWVTYFLTWMARENFFFFFHFSGAKYMWTCISQAFGFAQSSGSWHWLGAEPGVGPGEGWTGLGAGLQGHKAGGRWRGCKRWEGWGGGGVEVASPTQLNRSVCCWEHAISTRLNPPCQFCCGLCLQSSVCCCCCC